MKRIINLFLLITLAYLSLGTVGVYASEITEITSVDADRVSTTDYPKLISAKSVYGGVNIEWSSYGNAYAYRVFYYAENSWHHLGTTTSTSFFDSEVTSGKTYIFTVRAIDKNRNNISDYDHNGIKVTYLKSPEIKDAQSTKDGLKLTWNKIDGVYAYRVFYQSPDGWKGIGNSTSDSFVYADANSGTSYTYTVRGIDKNGNYITGFNSSGIQATFIATPIIYKIENTANGIKLTWNSVKGVAKYRVFCYGENSWHHLGTTDSTSFVDNNVTHGNTYTYTVRAIDKNGNFISDYDHEGIKGKYLNTPKIKNSQNTENGIKLTWDAIEGVYAYRVFWYTQNGWVGLGNSTSNSFIYANAESGVTHTYTVRGIDEKENYITGFYSSGYEATFVATPRINKIENTANGIKLTWNGVKGAAQYRVFRYGEDGWKNFGVTSETTFEDTNVSSGITYSYTVRCLDENRNFISGYNNSGWKQTFIAVPKISSLTSTSGGVKISWNKVPGAEKYRVFYKSKTGWTGLGDTSETTFIHEDADPDGIYTYTVRCITVDGKAYTSYYDTVGKTIGDKEKPTVSLSATNKVADTQEITIKLTDNVGIKGYYWGTSSTYSQNKFYPTSKNVTITVSKAEKNYIWAVDTSDNLSSPKSIAFLRTTLNPNNGSVNPKSVLTEYGKSFTFPTPSRSGYFCNGWSTSKSDSVGVRSLAPKTNTTYYAIWHKTFTWGKDNWRFNNSESYFQDGYYYIKQTYKTKLMNGLTYTEKQYMENAIKRRWRGSCYGMSVTSILGCYGILNPGQYTSGAENIYSIASPPSETVRSLINYYHLIQNTDYISNKETAAFYDSEKNKITTLLKCLEDDSPTLFIFYTPDYGHAIVAYKVEHTSGNKNGFSYNKKVLMYDNRLTNYSDNNCLYINTNNYSWYLPSDNAWTGKTGCRLGWITDSINDINYHGYINGINNASIGEFIGKMTASKVDSQISWSKLKIQSYDVSADASDDENIIMFSPVTGGEQVDWFNVAFKDSKAGYSMKLTNPESQEISMRYENCLIDMSTTNTDNLFFAPDGYCKAVGENTDYIFDVTYNDGYHSTDWFNIRVTGKYVDEASLTPVDEGYVLEASNLNGISVTAKNNEYTANKVFSTEYNKVYIYEIDENTIGLKVDTDGNGTYETELTADTILVSTDKNTDGLKGNEANETVLTEKTYEIGDVNLDGAIDIKDVTAIQKYLVGFETLTDEQLAVADVNCDGNVDINDSTQLQMYLAYLIDELG